VVLGAQWQTRKVSRNKTVKVLVISFSAGLDAGHAQVVGDYHLVAAAKGKKPGTGGKPIALVSATYDPAAHTVTLTPRGKVPPQTVQLTINAAGTLDTQGRPIDGNRDGQPGGDFQSTFGTAGVRLSRISPAAVDLLFERGILAP
jgi:hypothetical protein